MQYNSEKIRDCFLLDIYLVGSSNNNLLLNNHINRTTVPFILIYVECITKILLYIKYTTYHNILAVFQLHDHECAVLVGYLNLKL